MKTLPELDDDILIAIFGFLDVSSLLSVRQTCKRLQAISRLPVVWRRAFTINVLHRGYPYPIEALSPSMDSYTLERLVRRSCRIAAFWLGPPAIPYSRHEYRIQTSTGISEIRFLPEDVDEHFGQKRIVTASKGIWSEVVCWEIGEGLRLQRLAEWCPKGAIFTSIAVNSNPQSEGTIAVSLTCKGEQTIQILSLEQKAHSFAFEVLKTFPASYKPVYLDDDIIVFSDDTAETYVANWRTGESAILLGSDESMDYNYQYNKCLKVIFAHECILLARARSLELFPLPTLKPPSEDVPVYHALSSHTFGWVDGISIYPQHHLPLNSCDLHLYIIVRSENDDPWSSDMNTIHLYKLQLDSSYVDYLEQSPEPENGGATVQGTDSLSVSSEPSPSDDLPPPPREPPSTVPIAPYIFPPTHVTSFPSIRGPLRCTDILSGDHGTAIWIQPHPAHDVNLTNFDVHSSQTQTPYRVPISNAKEILLGAVFPGIFMDEGLDIGDKSHNVKMIAERAGDSEANWTAMDYDEVRGLVVLGSGDGRIQLLEL